MRTVHIYTFLTDGTSPGKEILSLIDTYYDVPMGIIQI